ncbi:hypothetical protein THRCLA_08900 [Thraustotheca clavata]|uniref:Fibronectin type-III domain-containing protein n=1 Tax=Thraustotheca clavata TaxID=74557 RepID=A0A1V9Z109_9STRA|nr:hypothetical protein THRCLA_08900 [Thraustotheca clavata]
MSSVTQANYLENLRKRVDVVLQNQKAWLLPSRSSIVVHFGPGFLGIGFGLSSHALYSVSIYDFPLLLGGSPGAASRYNASTEVASYVFCRNIERLVPGLLLTHINDVDVQNMAYLHVLDKIQAVGRPVKLQFSNPKTVAVPTIEQPSSSPSLWTTNSVANRVFMAVQHGHFLTLLELFPQVNLDWRYPEDGRSLLHFAARYREPNTLHWILSQPKGMSLVQTRSLQGRFPIHDAVASGNADICNLLYSVYPEALLLGDFRGILCAHIAAGRGHLHLFPWLMERGVEFAKTSDDGKTALHYACAHGHLEVAMHLIKTLHLDETSVDIHRCNCLHYAARHGHMDLVQWLAFNSNVPLRARNAKGLQPSQMAPASAPELKHILELLSAEPLAPTEFKPDSAKIWSTAVSLVWSVEELPLIFRSHNVLRCTQITRFELDYGRAYIGTWEAFPARIDASAKMVVVPGLHPNTDYSFRLRAWNENGHSAYVKTTVRTSALNVAPTTKYFFMKEARHLPTMESGDVYYYKANISPGYTLRSEFGTIQRQFGLDPEAQRHPQWSSVIPIVTDMPTIHLEIYRSNSQGDTLVGQTAVSIEAQSLFNWLPLENKATEGEILLEYNNNSSFDGPMADNYGYLIPPKHVSAYIKAIKLSQCVEIYRRHNWSNAILENNVSCSDWFDMQASDLDNLDLYVKALEPLSWKGVPRDLRCHVYFIASGASKLKEAAGPDYYHNLVEANSKDLGSIRDSKLISADVIRTFAEQPMMEHQRSRVEKLLLAFVIYANDVGYCQVMDYQRAMSMNFIAARLLALYGPEDETAFWVFAAICYGKFPKYKACMIYTYISRRYYDAELEGVHTDGAVLESLLQSRLPRLNQHCSHLQTPIRILAAQWFLPLFCQTFPAETTFRILDCIVLHRSTTVVFSIVLAHLRIAAPHLLQTQDYVEFSSKTRGIEANHLLEMASKEFFSMGNDASILRRHSH